MKNVNLKYIFYAIVSIVVIAKGAQVESNSLIIGNVDYLLATETYERTDEIRFVLPVLSKLYDDSIYSSIKLMNPNLETKSNQTGFKYDSIIVSKGVDSTLLLIDVFNGYSIDEFEKFPSPRSSGISYNSMKINLQKIPPVHSLSEILEHTNISKKQYIRISANYLNCEYISGKKTYWVNKNSQSVDTWVIYVWKIRGLNDSDMINNSNENYLLECYIINDSTGKIGIKSITKKDLR